MAVPSYNAPALPNIGGQIANLGQSVAVQLNQMTENAERRAAAARDEQYARLAQQRAIVDAENVARTKEQYNQQKVIEAAGGRDLAAQFMSLSYQLKNAGDDPIAKYTVLQQMDQLTGSGMNSLTNVQRAMMGGIVSQALEKYPQAKQAYDALNTVRYEPVTLGGQTTTLENLPALVQGSSAALAEANRMGNPMLRQMLAQLHPDRFYATGNGTLYSGADAVQGNSLLDQIKTGAKTVDALAEFDRSLETAAVVRQADAAEAQRLGIDISTATNAMAFNYALKHSKAQETMSSSDKASSQQRLDILNNMGEYAQVIAKQGFRVADLTQRHYTTGTDISDLAMQITQINQTFGADTETVLEAAGNDIGVAKQMAGLITVQQIGTDANGQKVTYQRVDAQSARILAEGLQQGGWAAQYAASGDMVPIQAGLKARVETSLLRQQGIANIDGWQRNKQMTPAEATSARSAFAGLGDADRITAGIMATAPAEVMGDPSKRDSYVSMRFNQMRSAATDREAGALIAQQAYPQLKALKDMVVIRPSFKQQTGFEEGGPVVEEAATGEALEDKKRDMVFGDSDQGKKPYWKRTSSVSRDASVDYDESYALMQGRTSAKTFLDNVAQKMGAYADGDPAKLVDNITGFLQVAKDEMGYSDDQIVLLKRGLQERLEPEINKAIAASLNAADSALAEKQFVDVALPTMLGGVVKARVTKDANGALQATYPNGTTVNLGTAEPPTPEVEEAQLALDEHGAPPELAQAIVSRVSRFNEKYPGMMARVPSNELVQEQATAEGSFIKFEEMPWYARLGAGTRFAGVDQDVIEQYRAAYKQGKSESTDKFLITEKFIPAWDTRIQNLEDDFAVVKNSPDMSTDALNRTKQVIATVKYARDVFVEAAQADPMRAVQMYYDMQDRPEDYMAMAARGSGTGGTLETDAKAAMLFREASAGVYQDMFFSEIPNALKYKARLTGARAWGRGDIRNKATRSSDVDNENLYHGTTVIRLYDLTKLNDSDMDTFSNLFNIPPSDSRVSSFTTR